MSVEQISVFLENKAGRLAAACAVLKDNGVNIRALTIAESVDYGILRMIVNNSQKALSALKNADFMVKINPVVAASIDDREGIVHDLVSLCDKENVNIEYTYSFVEQSSKKAILFLRFEDTDKAEKLLAKNGYTLLSDADISKI